MAMERWRSENPGRVGIYLRNVSWAAKVAVWTGEVSPISLAVVWLEPSDGKGSPAILLVSSARCEAALPRYHLKSTTQARYWENNWR